MKYTTTATPLAVSLMMMMMAGTTAADVVEYNTDDRDQWFADVGGPDNVSTVDFTGYPDNTPVTDQWSHLGITFTDFNVVSGPAPIVFPEDGWGLQGFNDIHFEFDTPMSYIAVDLPGSIVADLFLDDTLVATSGIFGGSGYGFFGGLNSDEAFNRVRLFGPYDNADFIDNLHFGPPIPAPATLAPLAIVLCARSRRRRR